MRPSSTTGGPPARPSRAPAPPSASPSTKKSTPATTRSTTRSGGSTSRAAPRRRPCGSAVRAARRRARRVLRPRRLQRRLHRRARRGGLSARGRARTLPGTFRKAPPLHRHQRPCRDPEAAARKVPPAPAHLGHVHLGGDRLPKAAQGIFRRGARGSREPRPLPRHPAGRLAHFRHGGRQKRRRRHLLARAGGRRRHRSAATTASPPSPILSPSRWRSALQNAKKQADATASACFSIPFSPGRSGRRRAAGSPWPRRRSPRARRARRRCRRPPRNRGRSGSSTAPRGWGGTRSSQG